ncbi:CC1-like family splicing factor [Phlyctema vagabunda]|uniref:CC1-like family splicing factor n=1 Tax=Phlyctema vagabunda TaxID=108571 RepID=A0ABR4PME2_9HELO
MPARTLPTLLQAEVASHKTAKSCYVTMGSRVFDITDFLDSHPGGPELITDYGGMDITQILKDEVSHTHSESAYEVLEDSLIGFLATEKVINTAVKSNHPGDIVPLPPTAEGLQELKEEGAANGLPIYSATGMSTAEDLNKETDLVNDYKTHKFLDLNKPLLMQIWFGGFSKDFYLEQVHRPRHYKGGASAPLFGNFLEPLSKTAWYVVPIIWLPLVAYGTFVAYEGCTGIRQEAAYWLFGLFLWTFFEYILHRFLFHLDKWLPDNRVALTLHFLLHGIHHYLPMDKLRLVMPPTLFLILATPFWKLAHTIFYWNWHIATAVYCGGIFGYVCYDLTHYFLHHRNLPSYWRELKKYHLQHHFMDYENGFGVTSRFWDRIFGTQLQPPVVKTQLIDIWIFTMSALDVEALLDSTANATPTDQNGSAKTRDGDDRHKNDRNDRRDRDRTRDGSRDRDRDRKRRDRSRDRPHKGTPGEEEATGTPRSEHGSAHGSTKKTVPMTAAEMETFTAVVADRVPDHEVRTDIIVLEEIEEIVIRPMVAGHEMIAVAMKVVAEAVAQREAELRKKAHHHSQKMNVIVGPSFFEKVGPVKEAQIVKDRVSGRSKGVGYVEFKNEESVPAAIQLTGQKLLGIPIIAQLTEAEKNRQVRNPEATGTNPNQIPFHRLYVGNIHFSITESDLQNVFEPFGELEFVQLQKEEQGRSRGYGFVQFRDPNQAREALEKMNGFDLAGRPIRVGLGNDKFTPESTASLLQRFQGQSHQQQFQGSAFSGAGGRGPQSGSSGGAFDRAGGRENEKGAGGASALDDTDVAGVNFNNYSRDALMRKLARTDEPAPAANGRNEKREMAKPKTETKPLPVNVNMASRCVVLKNMFDPAEEEGDNWEKELEDDVRAEAEEKYGHVVHISLDPNSQGDIYLKFDRVQGGENAIKGLNGRYFGGRMISATPVVDAVYSSLFSRTKAI